MAYELDPHSDASGAPPSAGWAALAPELLIEDIQRSLWFWCELLGFSIAYQRREEGFAYLERREGAQVMLCERSGVWETGPLERPYGRGVMFQIEVATFEPILARLAAAEQAIHAGPREVSRQHGNREGCRREVFIQDPDGYLIMLAEPMAERPSTTRG